MGSDSAQKSNQTQTENRGLGCELYSKISLVLLTYTRKDKLGNNTKIGALDHLRGCERKYEHLEYVTFELCEKFNDAYNVFLILDDRRL